MLKHYWYIKTYYNKINKLSNIRNLCIVHEIDFSSVAHKKEKFFAVNLFYSHNLWEKVVKAITQVIHNMPSSVTYKATGRIKTFCNDIICYESQVS